ncbi:MAG: HNH endonuclease [Chlorobiales bacterium]|nr:HNH endonuclease [Chlorobiales bacterium]
MPKDRQKIPTALRRRILIEARHRCAICRHTTVHIHHIVPWDECKKHEYSNLIAICPNCHDQAHKGAIDRQALLHYKACIIASNDQFRLLIDPNYLFDPHWGPDSRSIEEKDALIVNLKKRHMLAGSIATINWPLIRCDICESFAPADNCCTPQDDCICDNDEQIRIYCDFGCATRYQSLMREFMNKQPNGDSYIGEYMLQNSAQILEMTADQDYTP